MTNQEIFDTVLHGLRAQGEASFYLTESGMPLCRYRQESGGKVLKCAAGLLIDDADYSERLENRPTGDIFMFGAFGDKLTEDQAGFLMADLQNAHDHAFANGSMTKWEAAMQRVANMYSLTYTHPPIL